MNPAWIVNTIEIALAVNPEKLGSDLLNEFYEKYGELAPFNQRIENS